ncbi:MAG: hypothetical protein QME68_06235, partial [Elusimicrobiota bacterium]|nr:hypothetical protein [Elusimicrobiota bacterium]
MSKVMPSIILVIFLVFVFLPCNAFSTGDPPKDPEGPLAGKNIILSQGHGFRYKNDMSCWAYEGPLIDP